MPPARLRRGEVVRIREERWSVCRCVQHAAVAVIDVRGCDRSNRGIRTRFLLPFDTFQRLPAVRAMRIVSRRRWQHLARHTLAAAVAHYDSLRTLAAARIDILPFQLEPALAMLRGVATRMLIADEVGLGKTIQAGLLAAETLEREADARVLVVCPASLRDQWVEELATRFDLSATVLDSGRLARLDLDAATGANPWAAHRLIVTSVDYVKRAEVMRALESLVWDLVIVDEAHRLAGRSDRHAAAAILGDRARALVMLTATPHSGDEDAFVRLCRIGSLHGQFPLAVFRRTRRDAGLTSVRRTSWLAVTATPAERAMHDALTEYARLVWRQQGPWSAARLAMIVLLRRACSSAAALARSIERRMAWLTGGVDDEIQLGLPFGDEGSDEEPERALAGPGLPELDRERHLLQQILDLAHDARSGESKLRAIRRLLRRTGESAIVFTEYRDTLAHLAAALDEFGCVELHGGLGPVERQHILHRFVSGSARILIATDAASEGLNLHVRCRLVIHLELPWNPLRIEQRVGRVDRIGQQKRVHQLLLVAAGTAEQSTVATHIQERAARVEQTMAAMRPEGVDERAVAERILGLAPPPQGEASAAALPDGIFVADLRARAMEEAARGAAARRLTSNPGSPAIGGRPFAAAAPNGMRAWWSFRVAHASSEEDVLWEAIAGVSYMLDRFHSADAASLRRHLETCQRLLRPHIDRFGGTLLAAAMATLQPATLAAIAREQSIVAELSRRDARLAASLVQRPLFDRHIERQTSAQREVLQEAMTRSETRLSRLARRLETRVLDIEPVFAVILR
jgi:superfamily II DNA or RNA helicase